MILLWSISVALKEQKCCEYYLPLMLIGPFCVVSVSNAFLHAPTCAKHVPSLISITKLH